MKLTPIEARNIAKERYPNSIIVVRVGDFYEVYGEDATNASKVLGITITTRNKGLEKPLPMAGWPYHVLDAYLSKLVQAGYRVAMLEETAKGEQT